MGERLALLEGDDSALWDETTADLSNEFTHPKTSHSGAEERGRSYFELFCVHC